MGDTSLATRGCRQKAARIGAHKGQHHTRSGSLGTGVPGKIGISIDSQRDIIRTIAHPGHLNEIGGALYITDETIQIDIVLPRPLGDAAGEMANRSQQVVPRHSGAIEDFHEDLSSKRLQDA